MLSPPSERLETTNADVFPRLLTWLSPIRWAGETLIVAMTRDLSYAWKMPPFFYAKPHRESALAVVITPTFHEGWLYDVEVREFDDGVCRVRGRWIKNEVLNLPVLLGLGVASRLAALALLNWANESHFGRAPLLERLAARMRRGRRPAERPPRATSLVDGGDAARPDVDEEGPSFEEQRSRAPSKDSLPELRSVEEARFIALERFESGL